MDYTIIQWNCNGFYSHFEEIKLLISEYNPYIICVQESHFDHSKIPTLKNFHVYYTIDNFHLRASGGVAICVHDKFSAREVELQTDLQAIAVTLYSPIEYTVCNLYLPPNQTVQKTDLERLIQQLPQPFLITTDANAHNTLWGCSSENTRGKIIENLLGDLNLVLLNDGSMTHFSSAYNSYSALDLTILSPYLSMQFSWKVHDDLCSSDHFPIVINTLQRRLNQERRPRWVVSSGDWDSYRVSLNKCFRETPETAPDQVKHFTDAVVASASENIPKTSSVLKKFRPPWWNSEIKEAIQARRKALRRYNQNMNEESEKSYKIAKAKARRLIRQSRKDSWRQFVPTISSSTSSKEVWTKINKISGKIKLNFITSLKTDQQLLTTPSMIAEHLGKTFASVSSSMNYNTEFLTYKSTIESIPLELEEQYCSDINQPFNLMELKTALATCKGSSVGPDEVHYHMLKNLPTNGFYYLLQIYNKIWMERTFPDQWRESIVVAIQKQSKNPLNPNNYRPISLTSCMCKLLEKMVNKRLMWYLETNKLLDPNQSGFRSYRNTMDNLSLLETTIQQGFSNRECVVTIFFDLEKAYDMAWRFNIIRSMSKMGIRGNMLYFVNKFLENRSFRVIIGNTYSPLFTQENGIPQGSVLSVTLFLIAINTIQYAFPEGVKRISFADDVAAIYHGKSMRSIESQLQLTLNRLSEWSKTTGFRFSVSKTKVMHFCRKTSCTIDPILLLNGCELEVVDTHKFLGMHLDRKLTWKQHIKNTKNKALKGIQILRILSNTNWGSDRRTLLTIHKSLVLSRLDYGSFLYSTASKTLLKTLDSVHNQGIRLSTGAFRTSPVISILAESGMLPLSYRRDQQMLSYAIKISSNNTHPLYNRIRATLNEFNEQNSAPSSRSFVARIRQCFYKYNLTVQNTLNQLYHTIPPWIGNSINVDRSLSLYRKRSTSIIQYKKVFLEKLQLYKHYYVIYTDGSKHDDEVGCAFYCSNYQYQKHLPSTTSIFTAEITAIKDAIDYAMKLDANKILIASDSLSAAISFENSFSRNPLIQMIQDSIKSRSDKTFVIMWIPSHVMIEGNEIVDSLAKTATKKPCYPAVPTTDDTISTIRRYIKNRWQSEWINVSNNKLREIKETTAEWMSSHNRIRKESVLLTRLRIGHTRITHEHLFRNEPPSTCSECNQPVTVKHLLSDCIKFKDLRDRYQIDFRSIMDTNYSELPNLFKFLKETELYNDL